MQTYTINLGGMLRRSAHRHPNRAALVSHEGKELTYRKLNLLSNRFAHGLKRMGVKRGDHVATLLSNCNEQLVAFFGALKAGCVVVPINVRLAVPEIEWIVDHSDASVLIFSEDFLEQTKALSSSAKGLQHLIQVERKSIQGTAEFQDVLKVGKEEYPDLQITGDDDAFLVYTAGTTGRPKGVILSHNSVLWNCVNWAHSGTYREADRSLQVFPLYHVAAIGSVFTYLYLGGTVFLKRSFDPVDCLETIQRERITRWAAAPTVFHVILQVEGLKRFDTSSLTLLGWGAAAMPLETRKRLQEAFPHAQLFDNYGMTEAAGGITTLSPRDFPKKPGSVGKALISVEIRVVDDQDRDMPPGQAGEVVFRGNNLMKGYYKDPQATAEAFRGGWMHTGDMGRIDEEGFLYIVDRKKDMIITGAENVYPREIEEVLFTHPKIAEAAVIGVPDPKWGEAIKAVVVLKAGQAATEQEIMDFCRGRIAGYKIPKSVEFVDSLPKNAAGKVLKRELRARYE